MRDSSYNIKETLVLVFQKKLEYSCLSRELKKLEYPCHSRELKKLEYPCHSRELKKSARLTT